MEEMSINQTPNLCYTPLGDNYSIEEAEEFELDNEDLHSNVRYRRLSQVIKICQINVEGLTKAKCEYLGRFLQKTNCDVLLIQETHQVSSVHLHNCGPILNFECVENISHQNYGIATYVRSALRSQCAVVSKACQNEISHIIIKLNSISILNLYKPPNSEWENDIPVLEHPGVYMGDFNSHHTLWNYSENNNNGLHLVDWAINNNIHLMFDSKDLPTFHSMRWNRGYNPDLCFVSTDTFQNALAAFRTVGNKFPRSQHRPVFLEVGLQIPIVNSLPVARWNFRKANWNGFSKAVDSNIRWIKPIEENIERFNGVINAAAKKNIFPEDFEYYISPIGILNVNRYGSCMNQNHVMKLEANC